MVLVNSKFTSSARTATPFGLPIPDELARVVIANQFNPAYYGGRAELAQKGMLELGVALARGGAERERGHERSRIFWL